MRQLEYNTIPELNEPLSGKISSTNRNCSSIASPRAPVELRGGYSLIVH